MGKNWAIVVGINNYDNLQPLKYAKRDAEAMKAWFENEANFDQVFLFTEDSPRIPANPPIPTYPTQARFKRFLNAQFEAPLLKPEDNLWFFFAGHGKRFVDQDYLMFLDTDPNDRTTAISVDYVTQRLRRCGADNVVLLIDACRDEGSRNGLGVGMQEHKGVITFYSCAPSQQSWEIDELQHGSFTYTLLAGLRLKAEADCATVERLDQYLRDQVPQLNHLYKKPAQNPALKAEPPYKMYYILLEKAARIKDAEPLKYQASLAENEGDLLLAQQLWERVLAVSGPQRDVIRAIQRIALRQVQPPPFSSIPQTITPPFTSGGERGGNSEPPDTDSKNDRPTFNFDLITVDAKGREINRKQGTAEYFSEKLGNNVTLEMVAIPGGKFMMGSLANEADSYDDEKPQHEVTVPPFFMGKYPVTQAQWRAVAALPQINRSLEPDPSYFKGDNLPVEQISWYEAVEFCDRLSRYTQKSYRLPSEAEWEYACRAGTTTPFHFGETITSDLANYDANSTYGNAPKGEYRRKTTPVGNFNIANAFGLYDMHGNVWEWCADHWHGNYKGAPNDGSAWVDSNDINKSRLRRGGSWADDPWHCLSACRHNLDPSDRGSSVGFRVVVSAART